MNHNQNNNLHYEITDNGIKFSDGKYIELSKDQYKDLQEKVQLLIFAWLQANDICQKG